jgi:hypothetical protein
VIKFHCIHGVTFLIDGYYGEDIDPPDNFIDEDCTQYDDFDSNDLMDENNIDAHLVGRIELLEAELERQLNLNKWRFLLPRNGLDQTFYCRGNAPRTQRRKRLKESQEKESASKLIKITTMFPTVLTAVQDSHQDIVSDVEENVDLVSQQFEEEAEHPDSIRINMINAIEKLDRIAKLQNNRSIDKAERKTMIMYNKVQFICISAYLKFIMNENMSKMEAAAIVAKVNFGKATRRDRSENGLMHTSIQDLIHDRNREDIRRYIQS